MKISNIRLGFATNSSSTHSIILNPTLSVDWNDPDGEYGWQNFLLRSPQAKRKYLATQFAVNLTDHGFSSEYAWHIINGLLQDTILDIDDCDEYGIDHGSILHLPVQYQGSFERGKKLSFEFFQDLLAYIERDDIGIAGGNDNENGPSYGGQRILREIPTDGRGVLVARKDGQHWALFNRETGAKIRLSFTTDEPYTQATQPELVDIKITDFCPYGCEFCYQSSGPSGTHADFDTLDNIFRWLAKRQVFEVALGGGETTMHPQFAEIIERANDWYGFTPNFSTFSVDWMDNPKIEQAVLEYCGGFALSCTKYDADKIRRVARWIKANNWYNRVQAQIILGLRETRSLCGTMRELRESGIHQITLLGYKSFGRGVGQKVERVDMAKVIKCAKENHIVLGLDTLAVQDYGGALDEVDINSLLRTEHEGQFSCYVDAVQQVIARDSYSDEVHNFHTSWRNDDKLRFDKVLDKVFPFDQV